jgi:hypothetical protein
MNAAPMSGVFVCATYEEKFSEFFFGASRRSRLGTEIGQIHAIRFHRTTARRERNMLGRVVARRCIAAPMGIDSSSLSITAND